MTIEKMFLPLPIQITFHNITMSISEIFFDTPINTNFMICENILIIIELTKKIIR